MDSLWTPELYADAAEKFQFIVVTPIGLPRVNVTDIKPIWNLHGDFIFNTSYRVAGKRDDIVKEMKKAGYDEEDFVGVINIIDNGSITNDNFETLVDENDQLVYDVEVAGYEQWKDQYLDSQVGVKGVTLMDLLKAINPHITEQKVVPRIPTVTTSKGTAAKQTPSPKGKVGRKSTALQDKVDKALDEDKIINVSKITTTGTGTTTGVRRGKTSLFVAPNLPLTSNNLEGVLIAIDLLGGEDEHPEDAQAAREFKWKGDSSPKTTPAKTTSTTSTTTTRLIPQSKTVVPEAVQPVKRQLIAPTGGKKPTSLVSGLPIPETTEI